MHLRGQIPDQLEQGREGSLPIGEGLGDGRHRRDKAHPLGQHGAEAGRGRRPPVLGEAAGEVRRGRLVVPRVVAHAGSSPSRRSIASRA